MSNHRRAGAGWRASARHGSGSTAAGRGIGRRSPVPSRSPVHADLVASVTAKPLDVSVEASVREPWNDGWTSLQMAANSGLTEQVEDLVGRGADPSPRRGRTRPTAWRCGTATSTRLPRFATLGVAAAAGFAAAGELAQRRGAAQLPAELRALGGDRLCRRRHRSRRGVPALGLPDDRRRRAGHRRRRQRRHRP